MKKAISSLLALCLVLSAALVPASALETEQAKQLLALHYVEGVPPELLELDSLDAILDALGDPYTYYMTPGQYEAFNQSINGQEVVGIGATVDRSFDGGYHVMSVLPNSPALEAGLQPGDILIAVDGSRLTADTDPRVPILGEEGTSVTVTVLRDGRQLSFTLTRRRVVIPIISYEMADGAAYINCASFGETTAETFREALKQLEDQTNIWIVDLRSNPGGDSDATAASASYFIGGGTMLYFRDGAGNYMRTYSLPGFPDLTDKPAVILTSAHSASGAELFAGDIRSYRAGIALGQRTFGKGTAQLVLDETNCPYMENGEAMKITAHRFFAPDGATNHITGVLPTLLVSPENTLTAAFLLKAGYSFYPEYHLQIDLAGQTFVVDLQTATDEAHIAAFTELLQALPPAANLYFGDGQGWSPITLEQLVRRLELTGFSPRTLSDTADSPFAREIDTLCVYQILSGFEDGSFRPKDTLTRAQFCAMIASALNLPAGRREQFSDVDADAWYARAVLALADMGFISGYGDGSFRPENPVTFQEMAVILDKMAVWASMDGYDLDRQPLLPQEAEQYARYAQWAQLSVRNLDTLGALAGDLAPDDPGTREVAAAMLCRLMENIHLIWN